jgi:hypothetical protein
MVIIPNPPYSLDLAPCDPQIENETVSDIHRGSQAVLDGIKENDLHV